MASIDKESINMEERFKTLFKGIPIPTYAWKKIDDDLILIDYNDAGEKQSTSKIKDFIDIKATELYKNQPEILKNLRKCVEDKINITEDRKYKFRTTEKEGYFHITYGFLPPDLVIVHTEDISERVQAEQNLKYHFELEQLVSRLTSKFINISIEEIDENITSALKEIAQFSNAVRASLFLVSEDLTRVTNTHEWCADPKDSQIHLLQDIPFETFGYYKKILEKYRNVIVGRPEDLPLEAKGERDWIKKHGFRPALFIPIIYQNTLYGTVGFYGKINEKRDWSETFITMLEFLANNIVNVLERKKVEQNLKESEKIYKNLSKEMEIILNNIPVLIFNKDLEGRLIYGNKYFADSLNLSKEELVGKTGFDLFPEEQAKLYHQDDLDVISSKKPKLNVEEPFNTPDGTRWVLTSKIPFLDENGSVSSLIGMSLDMTHLKQAEKQLKLLNEELELKVEERTKKLKESEEKYKLISENANDLIAILNKNFEAEYRNEYVHKKLLGYSNKDVSNINLLEFIHPEDRKKINVIFRQGFKTGEGEAELRVKKKDGKYIWLDVKGKTFIDKNNEKKVILFSRDITERKKAEKALWKSKQLLERVFNSLMDAVFILDANIPPKIIHFNPATEKIFGYSRNEMLGRTTAFLHIDKSTLKKFQQFLYPAIEKNGYFHLIEFKMKRKDGTIFPSEHSVIPLEDERGKQVGWVSVIRNITERKLTVEKLKESEEKLRRFMDSATDGFILFDPELNYIDANNVTLRTLGLNKEDLIGKNILDIVPNLKETGRYDKYLDVIKTGKPFMTEDVIFNRLDGSLSLYLSVRAFKVGKNLGVIFTDITERKKVEKELIESHHFIQKITDSTPGVIYIYDLLKEKNFYASKSLNNVLGYTPEEFKAMGDTVLGRLIHANDLGPFMEYLEMLKKIKDDKIYEYEYRMKHKDEHWVWILNRDMIFSRDSKGMPLQTIGVASDITEHKKAEQKLKESEDRYKNESDNLMNILNTMEEGVVLINHQYEVEFVNPTFINEFGSYEGKKCYDFFHDREEVCTICRNEDVFKGKPVRREWYSKKTQKTYALISTPLKNSDGSVSILDIFHDISGRKRVEQKLKDLSRLKSELLRRVSHELKTPLVSIKGNADLLLNIHYDRLESDTISVVQEIKEGCERLEDLIKDLLESSQLESGQVKLKLAREDLAFLIKFCVKELESLAKIRNHKIDVEIHEKLNTAFEKEKIYEVINNLLSNAIKYTPPNGKIKIKSEIKDDFYVISVEDNGIGFTEKEKEQLFKQFGKIERYGQGWDLGIEGSGLGLYISKQIVDLHGGKIWVESLGRNKGSTFYFSLPIVKE